MRGAKPGAAVASMVAASTAALTATPGAALGALGLNKNPIAEKPAMWSSHRAFADCAGVLMIEGAGHSRAKRGRR